MNRYLVAMVGAAALLCTQAFAHKVSPGKILRQKECVVAEVLRQSLGSFGHTVVFTDKRGNTFTSIYDTDGRVAGLVSQISVLPEASILRSRLEGAVKSVTPAQKWSLNGSEYKYYSFDEVSKGQKDAQNRVSELIEDSCTGSNTDLGEEAP